MGYTSLPFKLVSKTYTVGRDNIKTLSILVPFEWSFEET